MDFDPSGNIGLSTFYAIFLLIVVLGPYWLVELIVERRDARKIARKKILEQAAEYDRLRDEEFRMLGWTGKY